MKYKSKQIGTNNKYIQNNKSQKIKNKQKNRHTQNVQQQEQDIQIDNENMDEIDNNVELQQENQYNYNNQHSKDDQQQIQQEQQGQQEQQQGEQKHYNNQEQNVLLQNDRNLEDYRQELGHKGVVYMSRVPPYMTPNYIRKLLRNYEIQRIYLLPESQWVRNNRIKHGGSKRICFRQGWIEFADKKQAKMAALVLNGQKMVGKKGSFYSEDVWNLKYLPKFKWHHLTQKLAHEQRLKKQRLRLEMDQQRKLQQHYTTQVHKSKMISGIVKSKISKGKQLKSGNFKKFGQKSTIQQIKD